MILIVNQHYGDLNELYNHIDNYLDKYQSDEFFMVITVDQVIDAFNYVRLKQISNINSRQLNILLPQENKGLSHARLSSLDYGVKYLESIKCSVDQVLFSSTNSLWKVQLDYDLACEFYCNDGLSVYQYHYDDYIYDRSFKLCRNDRVKFDEYLNDYLKPDMIKVCNYRYLKDAYVVEKSEKYYPELTFMHKCCKDGFINLKSLVLQEAWYNKNGLSRSFNRKSITNSRIGYSETADYFLELFIKNEISLNNEMIKRFCTDLVTLSDIIPLKKYKNTVIYPILIERMTKWSSDDDFNNGLKFIEN